MPASARGQSEAQRIAWERLWRDNLLKPRTVRNDDACPHAAREWHPSGQNAAVFVCRDCDLIVELGGKR